MFEDIFKRKKRNIEKMSVYGFIIKNGDVDTNLIEIENSEPYVLYKTSASGAYVGEIRTAVEAAAKSGMVRF